MLQCIIVPPHAESWPSGVRFGFTSNRRSAECASRSCATHIPFRRGQRTVDALERDLDACSGRSLRLRFAEPRLWERAGARCGFVGVPFGYPFLRYRSKVVRPAACRPEPRSSTWSPSGARLLAPLIGSTAAVDRDRLVPASDAERDDFMAVAQLTQDASRFTGGDVAHRGRQTRHEPLWDPHATARTGFLTYAGRQFALATPGIAGCVLSETTGAAEPYESSLPTAATPEHHRGGPGPRTSRSGVPSRRAVCSATSGDGYGRR